MADATEAELDAEAARLDAAANDDDEDEGGAGESKDDEDGIGALRPGRISTSSHSSGRKGSVRFSPTPTTITPKTGTARSRKH